MLTYCQLLNAFFTCRLKSIRLFKSTRVHIIKSKADYRGKTLIAKSNIAIAKQYTVFKNESRSLHAASL